jgi:hypothetical protein
LDDAHAPRPWRLIALLAAAFAVGAAGIFAAGSGLGAGPLPSAPLGQGHHGLPPIFRTLLTLAVAMLLGRALIHLLGYVKQPPVIGDILAGVALGPSLLGRWWPEAHAFLLPPEVVPLMGMLAWFGVSLYCSWWVLISTPTNCAGTAAR